MCAHLTFSEIFYDIDESTLGYYFLIENYEKVVGYIIVAATTDRDPVLEFGNGELTFDKSKGNRGYYLGTSIVFLNSSSGIVSNLKSINNKQPISEFSLARDPITNQAKWDYYLSDSSLIGPFATPYPTSKELAVTRIWQRSSGISSPKSSCGPTTGAMIVNYYKSKGYTIRGSSYYVGGNSGLVNHLYSEMNSGIFGTSLSDFAGGLFDHLRHDDKSTIWRGLAYDDATNHYIEYKDAIYTDRPVAIRYNFFVSSDSYVNYHFVAGIAYKEQNGTNYFGIKDPDNGETTTEIRYLSWDSQAKNFAMHLTIPQ